MNLTCATLHVHRQLATDSRRVAEPRSEENAFGRERHQHASLFGLERHWRVHFVIKRMRYCRQRVDRCDDARTEFLPEVARVNWSAVHRRYGINRLRDKEVVIEVHDVLADLRMTKCGSQIRFDRLKLVHVPTDRNGRDVLYP